MRYCTTAVLAILFAMLSYDAGFGAEHFAGFCNNGGFESGRRPWRGTFQISHETRRSGQASVCCRNDTEGEQSICSQTVVLNQNAAVPIVVSGWSRAAAVSGRKDSHYSLWCDVEYQNDLRPGQVDDWHIVPFDVGTHDWQPIESIFNPQYPIKRINFHAIFRHRHRGTVWFDDLAIRPLTDSPLAGTAQDMPQVRADDGLAPALEAAAGTAAAGETLLAVQCTSAGSNARESLRLFLDDKAVDDLTSNSTTSSLHRLPRRYLPGPRLADLSPPFASLCRQRHWDHRRLIVESAAKPGDTLRWQILLPADCVVRATALDDWEPQTDAIALRRLGDRLLILLTLQADANVDRCVFSLDEAGDESLTGVTASSRRQSASTTQILASDDGLQLELGSDGGIWSVSIANEEVTASEVQKRPFGLLVGDLFAGRFSQGQPSMQTQGRRVTVSTRYTDMGLHSHVVYEPKPDHISVTGTIEDDTGRDRAVDIMFRLPVGGPGWAWWEDIATRTTIQAANPYERDDLTFACITNASSETGVGLALSPEIPCRFKITFDPRESLLHLRAKYALAPVTKYQRQARFAFSLFRVDGKWGLRDAARRYYGLFPEVFRRRAYKEGGWLFAINPKKVLNLEDYGYYEGNAGLTDYCLSKGVLTFPYIIPGQRSIMRLPTLPKDYEAALAAVASFQQRPGDSYCDGQAKEVVENCRVLDADGKYPIRIRDDVGADVKPKHPINMVVFSVNCDPDLFADDPARPTVGRIELANVQRLVDKHPRIGGIYVDSTSGWVTRTQNVRRDHLPYTDYPLTYDEANGRPCIDGRNSTFEFLRELGRVLHSGNRLVFPNLGCGRDVCWLYFVSDVVGLEGRALDLGTLRYCRTLAYQRPTLRLDYILLGTRETPLAKRQGLELFFKHCALYGIYPSIGRYCDKTYEQFGDLYRTYMPILRRLGTAGWEPVTHAASNDDAVAVERFGPKDGELLLALYNKSSKQERRARLSVDLGSLGLTRIVQATELVTGKTITVTGAACVLGPDELRVLAMKVE